jgi:hypothetical protein
MIFLAAVIRARQHPATRTKAAAIIRALLANPAAVDPTAVDPTDPANWPRGNGTVITTV